MKTVVVPKFKPGEFVVVLAHSGDSGDNEHALVAWLEWNIAHREWDYRMERDYQDEVGHGWRVPESRIVGVKEYERKLLEKNLCS